MARIGIIKSFGLLITSLLTATLGSTALAVEPSPVEFTFAISPSARVLDALEDANFDETAVPFMMALKDESWDSPMLRIHSRNKPAIMLVNSDISVAPITSFSLTINGGPYAFGTGDFPGDNFDNFIRDTIYTDPGVSITGSSVAPVVDDPLTIPVETGQILTVTFDGLTGAPDGRKVIFNIDLDTTDPGAFQFPDFRLVLCGAPPSVSDPASISATFTGPLPLPNTTTLSRNLAADPNVPDFFETTIRPAKAMEMLEFKVVVIPEPTSVGLALAAVAVALAVRPRSRRG